MNPQTPQPAAPPSPPPAADVNLPLLVTTTIASTLLFVALVFGAQAWYEVATTEQLDVKSLDQVSGPLQDLRREQQQHIETYRWIDPAKHVAAIPIERAMDLLIKEQK